MSPDEFVPFLDDFVPLLPYRSLIHSIKELFSGQPWLEPAPQLPLPISAAVTLPFIFPLPNFPLRQVLACCTVSSSGLTLLDPFPRLPVLVLLLSLASPPSLTQLLLNPVPSKGIQDYHSILNMIRRLFCGYVAAVIM